MSARATPLYRAARGTGPKSGRPDTLPTDAPATGAADQPAQEGGAVRPHPDDEAWLKDLGYPKLGEDLQSRTTQHEHGPNAGGTQQGDTKAKRPSGSR